MPTCFKCGSSFPNRVMIDGVFKNLGNRKYCLECSPWGKHNTRDIHSGAVIPEGHSKCFICKKVLPTDDNFYPLKRGGFFNYCKECDRVRQNSRHAELKRQAIEYKGGKCILCGYSKCPAALDFHHVDPGEKDFRISQYKRPIMSDKICRELDKCVLLCRNCHSEVHAGVAQLEEHQLPKLNVEGSSPFARSMPV